ncbi:MAG: Zn-dependent hydrolase [Gammaproteobacteria bacterium]|nr:Zn-dependent hydrolase [Gammaproteobacteria bacterium]
MVELFIMIFKQLFEKESSTYTYLLSCQEKKETLLIDPVMETFERDLKVLHQLKLNLTHVLETHIHADHITSASKLREFTNCKIGGPKEDNLNCRDFHISHDDLFEVGKIKIRSIFTPGHTDAHYSYMLQSDNNNFVFSGDSLMIGSCGRTDFQSGSNDKMFNTIKNFFYKLDDHSVIFPAHDYNNVNRTTIHYSKNNNHIIKENTSLKDFKDSMNNLGLDEPKKMHIAIPLNMKCGKD